MRGFAERVGLRRFAAPPRRSIPLIAVEGLGRRPIFRGVATTVGWAVLLVSTSVEVCVARERARGLETRRSGRQACRARCYAARWCQRCVRARFYRILAAMRFLRFTPRAGVCFAGGLARCGCGLPCLGFCEFRVQSRTFNPGCKGQIGKFTGQIRNHGFFLWCILMTLIFLNHLSPTRAKRSFPVWPSFAAKWSSGIGVCSRISLHRDSRTV